MPFKETCRMEQRIALMMDHDTGAYSVAELCRRHRVSRQTFYEWKARRSSGEERWFEDRSHAVTHCPHETEAAICEAVIALRRKFPHFGPKKLKSELERQQPFTDESGLSWPSASTMGDILKRGGLIEPASPRRTRQAQASIEVEASAPHDEWAVDFKGYFRTRDGRRSDPLTISDTATRYVIAVEIVAPRSAETREAMERVFEEFGLPDAIRCDNGQPLGSHGCGGLSPLSVWWLKLGIEPNYTKPATPGDNGRHERMHRTLQAQTGMTPAKDAAELQARFDAFRHHFNEERPHEALGQTQPAEHWQPSRRPMPKQIAEPWYDADHEVLRVRSDGGIRWRGEVIFLSESLAGELVGIAGHEAGHIVRFMHRDLGIIGHEGRFQPFAPPRARLRKALEPATLRNVTARAKKATNLSPISPV
jgi:transposase InsO family protein